MRRLLLVVGLASSAVLAQGGPPPALPDERVRGDPDDEIVPDELQLVKASEWIGAMRALLTQGEARLNEARASTDAVLLTCVNEQVTQMKGVLRVAENALVALQEAAGKPERARLEFSKIRESRKRMRELYQAALNCAGADAFAVPGRVTVEVDPGIGDDPYYGGDGFFPDPPLGDPTGEIGDNDDPPDVRPPPASSTL